MRAGLLEHKLIFKELRKIQSSTGAVKKEYVPIYTCKGEKKRLSVLGNGIQANEEFIGNTLIFRVRWNPIIRDSQRVEFEGVDYDIFLLDSQGRRDSYLVTLRKINS